MTLAAIGFAVMNACAKEVSRRIPFLEVAATRSFAGLPLVLAYARFRRTSLRIHNRRVALLRVVAGTAAMGQTFYALATIPLAEASALLNLTPLFVALIGLVWLKERVRPAVAACLLLGLLGALLIFRPAGGQSSLGELAALGASLTSAVAMVSLRRLGATEQPEAVVATFLAGSTLVLGLLALPDLVLPSWSDAGLLLLTGLSATVGQLAMTRAYALDVAARVGGMNYLNILASLLLASLLFGERPDPLAAVGIAAILLSGSLLVWTGRREAIQAACKDP
jgi:drug/metabolite transporter (DMT)-like permease